MRVLLIIDDVSVSLVTLPDKKPVPSKGTFLMCVCMCVCRITTTNHSTNNNRPNTMYTRCPALYSHFKVSTNTHKHTYMHSSVLQSALGMKYVLSHTM